VFGGVPYLLWGVFVRTVFGLHSTWLVNSATHMWGTQRFITGDDSTNSFWVAILTFGEGWHNNHHAFPQVARHGLTWYEIDFNWYGIRSLQALGLAWDISLPKVGRVKDLRPSVIPEPTAVLPVPPETVPQEISGAVRHAVLRLLPPATRPGRALLRRDHHQAPPGHSTLCR
jgi:hypothetical protein